MIDPNEKELDYEYMLNTDEFKSLIRRKRRFLTPYVIVFLVIFFSLPILTSYTSILETAIVGALTWTWIYSLLIFAMVWLFTSIYMNKAKTFDQDITEIFKKYTVK